MEKDCHIADVLIVGAGMVGLMAAAELQRAGQRVLVLDKGRGVGGRLASRRIGAATFDHGAQFITARDSRFVAVLERAQQAGVVEEWCRGFTDGADGHARWRGKPTMTAVAKHLACGLDLALEMQVTVLRRCEDCWHAETSTGHVFSARAVILTPPVPQSLTLLDAGGIEFTAETRARLAGIEYERCLAVMAVLDGPSQLPPPGGLALAAGPIAWMADNQMKGEWKARRSQAGRPPRPFWCIQRSNPSRLILPDVVRQEKRMRRRRSPPLAKTHPHLRVHSARECVKCPRIETDE